MPFAVEGIGDEWPPWLLSLPLPGAPFLISMAQSRGCTGKLGESYLLVAVMDVRAVVLSAKAN